jgi:hypothetical protein
MGHIFEKKHMYVLKILLLFVMVMASLNTLLNLAKVAHCIISKSTLESTLSEKVVAWISMSYIITYIIASL